MPPDQDNEFVIEMILGTAPRRTLIVPEINVNYPIFSIRWLM
jgi:hypothetical protein